MLIIVKRLHPQARLPEYQTDGSAGADLFADEGLSLVPGRTVTLGTGICLEIPPGYEAQVRPRSGLAARHGVTVTNSPGTIDSDFRGEVRVILTNLGYKTHEIARGDRIAQLVIAPVFRAHFMPTDGELSKTERDEQGFGSTGK